MSLGYHGDDGRFHIDGITGPDEYSAIVRDNIYTNLGAARNLVAAADVAERWPKAAAELEVTDEEIACWRDAAAKVAIPYDEQRRVHQQDLGCTDREMWDFEAQRRATAAIRCCSARPTWRSTASRWSSRPT